MEVWRLLMIFGASLLSIDGQLDCPSDVIINRIAETTDDKSGIIRLICSAINFDPSPKFRWNITCDNLHYCTHSSMCSINITQRAGHLGIKCTATKPYSSQESFSRVYVLSIEERGQKSKDSSTECVNAAIAGVVGAAVSSLIIIAAVIVVCIIKRLRGMAVSTGGPFSQLYALFKKPRTQTITDRQSASLDILSIAGPTTADHEVDNAAIDEPMQTSVTRYVTFDNHYVTQEIEIGEQTTALKPMPTTAGKRNNQGISDPLYDTRSMSADIEHDYENLSSKGYKASQSPDTSCDKVARCDDDKDHYENVT